MLLITKSKLAWMNMGNRITDGPGVSCERKKSTRCFHLPKLHFTNPRTLGTIFKSHPIQQPLGWAFSTQGTVRKSPRSLLEPQPGLREESKAGITMNRITMNQPAPNIITQDFTLLCLRQESNQKGLVYGKGCFLCSLKMFWSIVKQAPPGK